MKKVLIILIIVLIFTFGVVFGKSWAQNSWITAAVNKGLEESGQTQNSQTAAKLNGLKNCELTNGIQNTPTGKEATISCINANKQEVKLKASATQNGKILFVQKYKFNKIEII